MFTWNVLLLFDLSSMSTIYVTLLFTFKKTSAFNESPLTPSNITHPVLYTNSNTQPVSCIILQTSSDSDTLFCPSPGRDSPALGASPSRSAVSLSPTKDETTFALSPTAKDSASAVLQESNHTSELQYSSLLSDKPKLPTYSRIFTKGRGTKSKRGCNAKTKRLLLN